MLKPRQCRECPACKKTTKSIICKVGKRAEASTYDQELAMYRNCPLDWK